MTARLKSIISLLILIAVVALALNVSKPLAYAIGVITGLLAEVVFDWASTDDTDDDDSDDDGYRWV